MTVPKIKIIFVVTKGNWGGAQHYVYDLATALPKSKFSASAVIGAGETLPQFLAADSIGVTRIKMSRNIEWFSELKIFFALRRIFKNEAPDIVHLNSSKAGLIGALAARLAKVPKIIFTAHGWAFNEERPRRHKLFIKFLHWLTVLSCHRTIAVSEKTAQQLAGWPGVKKKMTVIYNGIKPFQTLPPEEARRELLGDQAQKFNNDIWLGTISELHKNKGLEYLLFALRRVLDHCQGLSLTVIIIGEGEERRRLEQLIGDLKLTDVVFLVGHKDKAAELLSAFDIFTLTSITEGLPYSVLEAGGAGLPVLATAVGGIPEIITSMQSGILIKSKNDREIAEALKFMFQNPPKIAKMASTLKHKISRQFSTNQMVKKTIELYTGK